MNGVNAVVRLKDVIRRVHYSYSTEKTYCHWVGRYMRFLKRCQPDMPSEAKAAAFLSHLARSEGVSASTQNQALCALVFFYRNVLEKPLGDIDMLKAKRRVTVRHAPSFDEVLALLKNVRDRGGYPVSLIARLIYGCGLRVNEPLNLRIKDVCIKDSRLFLREAKGGKDRVVPIPRGLIDPLQRQLDVARARWKQDHADRMPVPLPDALARKYPSFRFTEAWYWVFPAHNTCPHPRTGETVRYRCLEINVQRAVRDAAKKAGIEGRISPHHLRHAYATHALERGSNPRDLQMAMGHSHLDTTMTYLHSESTRVASPFDAMEKALA